MENNMNEDSQPNLGEILSWCMNAHRCPITPEEEYGQLLRGIVYRLEALDDVRGGMRQMERRLNPGLSSTDNLEADMETLAAYHNQVEYYRLYILSGVQEFWAFMEGHGSRVPLEEQWHEHELEAVCREF